jgi:hypothetical protein
VERRPSGSRAERGSPANDLTSSRTPRLRRGAASGALAAVGLLAALGFYLLAQKAPDDVLRVVGADLEVLIRENAAGAQARADTLAQLPRLGWAVATDEGTMRDLTTEELAFRPHPGEHIEITQMRKGGGEPRRLLRLPAESDLTLPVLPGTHVVAQGDQMHVVTVVSVEPRQRAEEVVGILAVAKQIDVSAVKQRLAARGISAELRTIRGAVRLAGGPLAAVEAKIPLSGAAAEGAELVATNVARARFPRFVSPLVLAVFLAAAGVLWWRGGSRARPPASFGPLPTEADAQPPSPPEPRTTAKTPAALDDAVPERADEWAPGPSQVTPAIGNPIPTPPVGNAIPTPPVGNAIPTPPVGNAIPTPPVGNPIPPGAAPEVLLDQGFSGRVEIQLHRSGSVSLSPGAWPIDPSAPADPRAEEYKSLFAEFVKLRRTTGEPIEGLDAANFVATLRNKRAEIMKQIPVKDVRFKLAFHNGKAAIRYQTVA